MHFQALAVLSGVWRWFSGHLQAFRLGFGVWRLAFRRSDSFPVFSVLATTLTFADHPHEILFAVLYSHGNVHTNFLFPRALFPVTWYYTASWWQTSSHFFHCISQFSEDVKKIVRFWGLKCSGGPIKLVS
ncbi:hypothetical protein F4801DRAFT_415620 [Xylaria longipes]|nr:hypothetical protein F4801DRAFT_415620 [Xylaria longipes]